MPMYIIGCVFVVTGFLQCRTEIYILYVTPSGCSTVKCAVPLPQLSYSTQGFTWTSSFPLHLPVHLAVNLNMTFDVVFVDLFPTSNLLTLSYMWWQNMWLSLSTMVTQTQTFKKLIHLSYCAQREKDVEEFLESHWPPFRSL
jgi:hypothetical protein